MMTKLKNIRPEQASPELAETYSTIKQKMGGVINLFQALGNSAVALNAYLEIGGLLKKGSLSQTDIETIALVSAEMNACQYCLAAHTALAKSVGLNQEEILNIRKGKGNEGKSQALIHFVQEVISERGRVSDGTYASLKASGYSDSQVPEIFLAIIQNVYTNYFNNFNGTTVDFPKVEKI